MIELDVQLSVDGHVMVFHDARLDRTSTGSGPLAERTLAELRTLDAGGWFGPRFDGERIPTLEEVLAWARGTIPLLVELKYDETPGPALGRAAVQLVQACKMMEQVMFISFAHQALQWVKQEAPDVATAPLYSAPVPDPVGLAREIGANAIMPLCHAVTEGDVIQCHDAGLSVQVWGAGVDYARYVAMGVDCVNADNPAQIRQHLFGE
jgi:glycerophosphoryl diester phosphodiesterase